jgi:hypothetical protein
LEDLAARRIAQGSLPVVKLLDKYATELARLAGRLSIETLQMQAERADN